MTPIDDAPIDDARCRYILDGGDLCGAPQKPGSAYCAPHHAFCYLAPGSTAEKRTIVEIALIARGKGRPPAGAG